LLAPHKEYDQRSATPLPPSPSLTFFFHWILQRHHSQKSSWLSSFFPFLPLLLCVRRGQVGSPHLQDRTPASPPFFFHPFFSFFFWRHGFTTSESVPPFFFLFCFLPCPLCPPPLLLSIQTQRIAPTEHPSFFFSLLFTPPLSFPPRTTMGDTRRVRSTYSVLPPPFLFLLPLFPFARFPCLSAGGGGGGGGLGGGFFHIFVHCCQQVFFSCDMRGTGWDGLPPSLFSFFVLPAPSPWASASG